METLSVTTLDDFRLRANPAYELVLFDRLSAVEQQTLDGLSRDPDCFGILRPREPGAGGIKSVSRDTALLLFALREPGPLPRYVRQTLGEQCGQVIAQMVLDGILEIEHNGVMLSGPSAHVYLCAGQPTDRPQGALASLSHRALEYAQTLEIADAGFLSARLYSYNRLPATPHWRRLLPDRAAVERHLGIGDGAGSRELKRAWMRVSSDPESSPWLAWQSPRAAEPGRESGATYKLYVSPSSGSLREAFQAAAQAAARSRAHFLKAGSDVYGLLRPDKIVLYFREFADLQETGAEILRALSGCPPHGVPFSAELSGGGLLSWGMDPPSDEHTVPWLERESWRLWITNRLATALLQAKTSGSAGIPPWRFALDRLRVEGVDTETWTPSRTLSWAQSAQG